MFFDQFKGFNPQTNRWERYAECYGPIAYGGQTLNPIYQMCFNNDPLIALTSAQKHDWIRDHWKRYDYYIGLYRNDNGDWVWTDFDGSEIPLGNYQPCAPGYDASSDGDCVHANATSVDNTTISLWVPSTCYPTWSQLFCGTLGCDANRTDCAYL
uniref:C-type lectin domain-containing protein n=1 Tax=Acrobeloides nanus TaxID=290746 RepID=A0A914CFU4_9BILA